LDPFASHGPVRSPVLPPRRRRRTGTRPSWLNALAARCIGADRGAVGGLRRRWCRRPLDRGGRSAALPEHFGSVFEHLPNRIRTAAGKGERLQENDTAPSSQNASTKAVLRSSQSAASSGPLVLVVRRYVQGNLLTPRARRCQGQQRRGLVGRPGATWLATAPSPSTSNQLRRRSLAAEVLARRHVMTLLSQRDRLGRYRSRSRRL
jgi:hypothetical protein